MCDFPNCKRHPTANGYCIGHKDYGAAVKKEVKPIPKKSAKLKKQETEYKKIVKEMLSENDRCEMNTPECTGKAQGLHHMKRRGINLLNRKYLKRSCNRCNEFCERFPLEAIKLGLVESKFKKEAA